MTGSAGAGRLGIGVIGTGRMGSFHAETVARRLPTTRLVAVADADQGRAASVADRLGSTRHYGEARLLVADPEVEAVVVAAPARSHADLVVEALETGKHVFCEKPMFISAEDAGRVLAAAAAAGTVVQVGFNRRFGADFAAARAAVVSGELGSVQLLRSLTRDPGLADPGRVPEWTIFFETLIHDFDMLAFLNPGARVVEVFAVADALVAPDFKDRGLLDTAVVTIRYDNGALATAEASFSAAYGYDVRAEVFGSAGMMTAGAPQVGTSVRYTRGGAIQATVRSDTELFFCAYVAELSSFAAAVQGGGQAAVGPREAWAALEVALACVESVRRHEPVPVGRGEGAQEQSPA